MTDSEFHVAYIEQIAIEVELKFEMISQLSMAIRNSGDPAYIASKLNDRRRILGKPLADVRLAVKAAKSLTLEERLRPLDMG